jgi:hypothetical protein
MHKYEAAHGPLLDDVTCGRPEGHNGVCRSVQALEKARQYSQDNWPKYRVARNERKRRSRLPLADQLAIAVADAAEDARWSALGR